MSHAAILYRSYDLPWTLGEDQERRFKRVLVKALGAVVAFALLLSVLPAPERDPAAIDEIPPRFARLILETPEPPPPPPPVVERQEPVVPEPLPEVPAAEPAPVVPEPEPAPEEPRAEETPVETPPPIDRAVEARERARTAGVLPFAEQLSALRDSAVLAGLDRPQQSASVQGEPGGPASERSLITSRVGQGSGGIDTSALSRETGGTGLAEHATARVESPVEGGTSRSSGPAGGGEGESSRPSRSREEIERVFDQNKGAIYALYNRALRENPALEGKLVLRLTIAPDGRVTDCEVVSSELGDPTLEQRLVQRVMLFRFEPKEVAPVTTTKPIDFFPA